MQYGLMIYESAQDYAKRKDPKQVQAYWGAWGAYSKAIHEAGIFVGGAGLEAPEMGTTLRLRGGKRQVQDGPIADSKEQFGGIFLIEVPNLDAALDWAARAPISAEGAVEVRPVLPPPPPKA